MPMARTCRILIVAVGLLGLAGAPALAQTGHNPFQPEASPMASPVALTGGWEVVDERPLDIPGDLVALSPNGQWIAGIGQENVFCVWDVVTLDGSCDEEPEPIDPHSVSWAPDSSAVAYSLDALVRLYDSDIFVFDVADGFSTNLTDDGFRDSIPLISEPEVDTLPVDIFPAWTADAASLVFARSEGIGDQRSTELMTIPRNGGDPELLQVVADDAAFAVTSPMFTLSDGSILVPFFIPDAADDRSGLWLRTPDGTMTQVMEGSETADFPFPYMLDVREGPEGATVTGYSRWHLGNVLDAGGPVSFQLNLENGTVTPGRFNREEATSSYGDRFSPDGASTVAIVSLRGEPTIVVTGPDGTESGLAPAIGTQNAYERGIDWADNNTLLLQDGREGGTLLTIAPMGAG